MTTTANRELIETALATGQRVATLGTGDTAVDRGPRLASGCLLQGGLQSRLINTSPGGKFGDTASLQSLQGHDFAIGGSPVPDKIVHGATKGAVILTPSDDTNVPLPDPAHYPVGSLCWTWHYTQTGVTLGPPVLHAVKKQSGVGLLLDPAPALSADVILWMGDGRKVHWPISGYEGRTILDFYGLSDLSWIGRTLLVSDGPTIANEPRGELRTVTGVTGNAVSLDRPLRLNNYRAASLAVCPVNVVRDCTIRDLTLGAGPGGFSFFGKYLYNCRFENVHFEGVCEVCESAGVTFAGCTFASGLKLNCSHDVGVYDSALRRLSFEECCHDVLIDGGSTDGLGQLPGITCDPFAGCERITIRNHTIRNVYDMPFNLEGRECRVEHVTIAAGPGPGNCYLMGDDVKMIGVASDRILAFKNGSRQFAQALRTPSLNLGWIENGDNSSGVAKDVQNVTQRGAAKWSVYA